MRYGAYGYSKAISDWQQRCFSKPTIKGRGFQEQFIPPEDPRKTRAPVSDLSRSDRIRMHIITGTVIGDTEGRLYITSPYMQERIDITASNYIFEIGDAVDILCERHTDSFVKYIILGRQLLTEREDNHEHD